MRKHAPILIPGGRSTPSATLRLLVALLVLLVLATPVAAAIADPAPSLIAHADHIGSPDDGDCQPFHDEAFCMSCSVLFNPPLRSGPGAALPTRDDLAASLRDVARAMPYAHGAAPLRARAPPLI